MLRNKRLGPLKVLTILPVFVGLFCLSVSTGLAAQPSKSIRVKGADASKSQLPATSRPKGEVLVKFKKGVVTPRSWRKGMSGPLVAERMFAELSKRRDQVYLHVTSNTFSTAELLENYRSDVWVESVSRNYARKPHRLPGDPYFGRLWGLRNIGQSVQGVSGTLGADIDAALAWNISTGDSELVVAVIDSGVDYNHEDLSSNMWQNIDEVSDNGIDDDGNGYVDDVYGYDFAANYLGSNDSDPMDMETHGSHVAGTAAAAGDNGIGITGVAWNAKIMALKAMRPDGYLYDSDIMEAIEYAVIMKERGVNVVVVNASFGGTDGSQTDPTKDIIAEAGQSGIVFVASAGNEGSDNDTTPQYPASYEAPNIISVAASDQFDDLATFSNFGTSSVDLAAPGVGILSTVSEPQLYSAVWSNGGEYEAVPFEYAGDTSGITGNLYDCGKGYPEQFPPTVSGNIALIERGSNDATSFYFSTKVQNAMDAGAVAVVVYNNVPGLANVTLGSPGAWIPAVFISQADGQDLASLETPEVTVFNGLVDYDYLNGTSMAAPQVSGAVAVLAAAFPHESVSRRIDRILGGVEPLGTLFGKVVTGGRLNLYNSLRSYQPANMAPVYQLLLE